MSSNFFLMLFKIKLILTVQIIYIRVDIKKPQGLRALSTENQQNLHNRSNAENCNVAI